MTFSQMECAECIRREADRVVYDYTLPSYTKVLAETGGHYTEYTIYPDGYIHKVELKGEQK